MAVDNTKPKLNSKTLVKRVLVPIKQQNRSKLGWLSSYFTNGDKLKVRNSRIEEEFLARKDRDAEFKRVENEKQAAREFRDAQFQWYQNEIKAVREEYGRELEREHAERMFLHKLQDDYGKEYIEKANKRMVDYDKGYLEIVEDYLENWNEARKDYTRVIDDLDDKREEAIKAFENRMRDIKQEWE